MTCNIGQYLPGDDSSVIEVEHIVHLRMVAQQGSRKGRGHGRGHFIPPQNIEFIITTHEGHTLHLIGYCVPEVEKCHLSLHHGNTILRKFDAHEGHINPHHRNAPIARTHIHFPSTKYPLIKYGSSYAYSIIENADTKFSD